MSAPKLTPFEFVHGTLEGGKQTLSLPVNTSITTIVGLFRDLTGANILPAMVDITLQSTVKGDVLDESVLGSVLKRGFRVQLHVAGTSAEETPSKTNTAAASRSGHKRLRSHEDAADEAAHAAPPRHAELKPVAASPGGIAIFTLPQHFVAALPVQERRVLFLKREAGMPLIVLLSKHTQVGHLNLRYDTYRLISEDGDLVITDTVEKNGLETNSVLHVMMAQTGD
jgi:hypothetical protein